MAAGAVHVRPPGRCFDSQKVHRLRSGEKIGLSFLDWAMILSGPRPEGISGLKPSFAGEGAVEPPISGNPNIQIQDSKSKLRFKSVTLIGRMKARWSQ